MCQGLAIGGEGGAADGALRVGPGILHRLDLHSGIPIGSLVSSMLLSHCEKEFQKLLSSGVSGSSS